MKGLPAGVVPEVMARYESFDTKGLNVPSMRPYYLTKHYSNLIGKDFKVAVQAAPFVLFEYMSEDERFVWSALCQLAPLVFQTHIADMDAYQISLRQLIRVFIYHLIKTTAQWVNKPKIHMLLHLADSILRFGPAALFVTEKFESYNGVLRKSSIHSNRQSPGKDIGISFANFRILRHLASGGFFFNHIANAYQTASAKVLELFANSPSVQKSMGYNTENLDHPIPFKPTVGGHRFRKAKNVNIPADLATQLPGHTFKQLPGIHLTRKDVLRVGSFVLVSDRLSCCECYRLETHTYERHLLCRSNPTMGTCWSWGKLIICGKHGRTGGPNLLYVSPHLSLVTSVNSTT
jgi:hypothetical protein